MRLLVELGHRHQKLFVIVRSEGLSWVHNLLQDALTALAGIRRATFEPIVRRRFLVNSGQRIGTVVGSRTRVIVGIRQRTLHC